MKVSNISRIHVLYQIQVFQVHGFSSPPNKCHFSTSRIFTFTRSKLFTKPSSGVLSKINIDVNVLKLQIHLTYYRLNILFCIISFLHNCIPPSPSKLLQSTDQLQASLPSDQDCNNTLAPSWWAVVNDRGCRTRLIFPSLSPGGDLY